MNLHQTTQKTGEAPLPRTPSTPPPSARAVALCALALAASTHPLAKAGVRERFLQAYPQWTNIELRAWGDLRRSTHPPASPPCPAGWCVGTLTHWGFRSQTPPQLITHGSPDAPYDWWGWHRWPLGTCGEKTFYITIYFQIRQDHPTAPYQIRLWDTVSIYSPEEPDVHYWIACEAGCVAPALYTINLAPDGTGTIPNRLQQHGDPAGPHPCAIYVAWGPAPVAWNQLAPPCLTPTWPDGQPPWCWEPTLDAAPDPAHLGAPWPRRNLVTGDLETDPNIPLVEDPPPAGAWNIPEDYKSAARQTLDPNLPTSTFEPLSPHSLFSNLPVPTAPATEWTIPFGDLAPDVPLVWHFALLEGGNFPMLGEWQETILWIFRTIAALIATAVFAHAMLRLVRP